MVDRGSKRSAKFMFSGRIAFGTKGRSRASSSSGNQNLASLLKFKRVRFQSPLFLFHAVLCLVVICVCSRRIVANDIESEDAKAIIERVDDAKEAESEVVAEDDDAASVASELASQETKKSLPYDQLSPLDQVRVITGLFTILILGLVIFIVIKAGSHMVQGMSAAANRLPTDSSPKRDDWADKPLNEEVESDATPGEQTAEESTDDKEHED